LATEQTRSTELAGELRAVVRRSAAGVLVFQAHPLRWPGGAVVAVYPRWENATGYCVGPGVWLGPLSTDAEREALCGWLRRGGPAAEPLPHRLRRVLARPPRRPMASHTSN
jgi:hypothetical protein